MTDKTGERAMILSENHWRVEIYKQRITKSQWRMALLAGEDQILCMGRRRTFIAKDLGYGVVEVSKAPLEAGA